MIYLVDIENIPNRYSAQWRQWHLDLFEKNGLDCTVIGFDDVVETKPNEFMSFIPSNNYKSRQTLELSNLLATETIKEDDVVFFLDAWHPGIISLFQMKIFYPHNFKMVGFWHAGSYDIWDILGAFRTRFLPFENAVYHCLDWSLFATEFHRQLFVDQVLDGGPSRRAITVGFLYDVESLEKYNNPNKEDLVVFPHRLAKEKQPQLFDELSWKLSLMYDLEFVKTMEVTKSKQEYYELLGKAKYSVSFALQETFGISMIESLFCGSIPLVPDRLSYQELFPEELRYSDKVTLGPVDQGVLDNAKENIKEICSGKRLVNLLKDINNRR